MGYRTQSTNFFQESEISGRSKSIAHGQWSMARQPEKVEPVQKHRFYYGLWTIVYGQILHINLCIFRMCFNEFAARGHIITHQHGEYPVCFGGAFNGHLFQCPAGWIHGSFP